MGKGIREDARARELEPVSLSGLIHQHVRIAIETAVHEELRARLGATPYERSDVRRGYRDVDNADMGYFVLQLAESHLTGILFRQIVARIERLAWHPT